MLLALLMGCPSAHGPHERAADDPHAIAPLGRTGLTVADRSRWFASLKWPSSCEDEFAGTNVTEDAGLDFHVLQQGTSLLIVRCALGAYQPTSLVLLLDEKRSPPTGT